MLTAALTAVVLAAGVVATSLPEAPPIEAATAAAAGAAVVPGLGVELPELRTATSRTYESDTGQRTAQISRAPVNYQDATGAWQPIDNTLVSTLGSLRNRANSYAVDLPQRLTAHPVRVQKGDDWVSFALQGAAPAVAIAAGAEVRYPGALPGVEVTYAAGAAGVKETLVLTRPGTATSFAFDLQLAAGLTPRVLESGAIALVDSAGAQRMTLAAPFMVDAAGASSRAVNYTLARQGSGWSLGLVADPKWLAASSRQFPVEVDPTVNLAPELGCFIKRRHHFLPENQYDLGGDCQNGLLIGVQPDLDFSWLARPVVWWDLSGIPSYAVVSEAEVTGGGSFEYTPNSDTVTAYPLTQAFDSTATWDNPWTTPGGDFDAQSGVAVAVDGGGTFEGPWDVQGIVQDWVDGSRDNNGLIFIAEDESDERGSMGASLSVTYSVPVCPSDPFAAAGSSAASTVYAWNQILLEAFRRQGGAPTPLARAAAMMHVGIYDVLNSVYFAHLEDLSTGTPSAEVCGWAKYLVLADADLETDANLAAGIAARDILLDALPDQSTYITGAFNGRHSAPLQPEAVALGGFVADAVIAARDGDGSDVTTPYVWDSSTPGAWRPTQDIGCTDPSTPTTAPATPNWGNVTPFTLTSGSQFRQPLPGGSTNYASLLGSNFYAVAFDDVKGLGRYNSGTRTSDQTEAAWFWANDLDLTYKPPGQLLQHTEIVAKTQPAAQTSGDPADFFHVWSQQGIRVARLFAEVSLALGDAGIASWDQKYRTAIDLWRPVTAIQQADTDGNGATQKDQDWLPLSATINEDRFSPCFPAWVSGHATFGGAWGRVMEREFTGVDYNNPFPLTLTTEDPHSLRDFDAQRQFDSFAEAAQENARSRIYLGVHFQFDGVDGLATGRAVANHVTSNFLRPNQTCANWACGVTIP